MTPSLRKLALIVHLVFSIGWIGAVVVYLVLGISAVTSKDAQTVRAAWIAMELTGWSVIVPLALGSLLTGLVMALGTPWGLFRHYWVLISLVLTVFSTVILLLHMPTVSALAQVAREADGAVLRSLGGDLLHPSVGLLVLLAITVLNVCKPRGLTPYGWRQQQELSQTPGGGPMATTATAEGLPLGLKLLLAVIGTILVGFVVLHLAGGGLTRHDM